MLELTRKNLNIEYVYKYNLNGLGSAVLLCKDLIQDNFALMLSDEVFFRTNALKQVIDYYYICKGNVIGIKYVYNKEKKNYGMVKVKKKKIVDGIEKPIKYKSNYAVVGRYVFTKEIFTLLENCEEDDIGLSNVIFKNLDKNFYGIKLKGKRFDIGNKLGYFKCIKYVKNN